MSEKINEITIVFDVDGTLINNSKLSAASTMYAFEEVFGLILCESELDFLNVRFSVAIPEILKQRSVDFDVANLNKAIEEMMYHKRAFVASKENLNLINSAPGALELLSFLKENRHLVGVASNGYQPNIELILTELGIAQYVDCIHAESDLRFQKPNYIPILHVMLELAQLHNLDFRRLNNDLIFVGDTVSKDGIAVERYNRFAKNIGVRSDMKFALVDLCDRESKNSRSDCDYYLGGNLMNLKNLL
jgi:phosphoglycolate phosphatase-like HAD superfamily hydrolase